MYPQQVQIRMLGSEDDRECILSVSAGVSAALVMGGSVTS